MPTLSAALESRPTAPWGRGAARPVSARVREFVGEEKRIAQAAARVATDASRRNFKYVRPPVPSNARASRESTGGRFASHIDWRVDRGGQVSLDIQKLQQQAPHWIILEIGTGERARMQFAGDPQRGVNSNVAVRTVRAQRGRVIHAGLVFADAGGNYSPPGAARNQQLFARQRVIGAPRQRLGIRIKREIQGQHFIQKGAQEGFRQYRESVLAAARQSFRT